MASAVKARLITDAVIAELKTLPGLGDANIFRAEVPEQPPRMVDSPRVGRYVVVYPFPGAYGPGDDLADSSDDIDYGVQVTCAAGFTTDCEALVDDVKGALYGFIPVVENLVMGPLKPPPGYDPGPIRVDRTITPPRSSLPLQYRAVGTAN